MSMIYIIVYLHENRFSIAFVSLVTSWAHCLLHQNKIKKKKNTRKYHSKKLQGGNLAMLFLLLFTFPVYRFSCDF